MLPALSQSTKTQRQEGAHSQHEGISVDFGPVVDERTDAGILVAMYKISAIYSELEVDEGNRGETHTKSSVTLCSPEGRDLNSTLSSSFTLRREKVSSGSFDQCYSMHAYILELTVAMLICIYKDRC